MIHHPEGEIDGWGGLPRAYSRSGGSDKTCQTFESPVASLSAHLPCPFSPAAHPKPPSLAIATWGPGSLGSPIPTSFTRCPVQSPTVASLVPFGLEVPLQSQTGGPLGNPQTKFPRCEVAGPFHPATASQSIPFSYHAPIGAGVASWLGLLNPTLGAQAPPLPSCWDEGWGHPDQQCCPPPPWSPRS